MARIFPSDLTRLALGWSQRREVETLLMLASRLSDQYAIFHGVHWTREYRGDTVYGEIDFAVVNRSGRVLIIEQKTGTLHETGSALVARYPDGDKSVAEQLHRTVDNVRAKFARQYPGEPKLDLDYLVYCPDHRVRRLTAVGLDGNRVVDGSVRDRLAEYVQEILGPGTPQAPARAQLVEAFFRQTFHLAPDIHAFVRGQERSFARLGGGLLTLIEGLEMSPFRLRVLGTAGSGKTMAARQMFDRAIGRARRPMLLCFNRPLSERLKTAVASGGVVTTWYGLCAQFLETRGHRLDFERMRDPGFWERISEMILGEPVSEEWKCDTLIVDEGQDFEQFWADALGLLLRPDAEVIWFEDPDQNIRRLPSVRLDHFVTYRARVNYRSPRSIAQFIHRALPQTDFESGSDLPGLGVGLTRYRELQEQPAIVSRLVAALLRQGFRHDDIVVLTTRHVTTPGTERSIFSSLDRIGGYSLRRFMGEYDLLGRQILTDGQITFDSIPRFKGQEAPAVILVDIDPDPADAEHEARLLLSGMTRATVRLELVVREGNALNAGLLRS